MTKNEKKNNQTKKMIYFVSYLLQTRYRVQLKVEPPKSMITLLDIFNNSLDHFFILFCTLSMTTPLVF